MKKQKALARSAHAYVNFKMTLKKSTKHGSDLATFTLHIDLKFIPPPGTESCFRHPLFDLRGTRKVEIRHTNFHFSSKKVTSKSRKVEVFDLTIVKKLSTFRPKKVKVEKLKSRKVEKLKS